MFLAANKHIHVGCGSSMTFSTSKNIYIEAAERFEVKETPVFKVESGTVFIDGLQMENETGIKIPSIYLGNPNLDDGSKVSMFKGVLGENLVSVLAQLINELKLS